jgi:hypothetical protein
MNSGLYDRDGASATARHGGCATRFLGRRRWRQHGRGGVARGGRHETDHDPGAIHFLQRLGDHPGVVLRDPVLEQPVRHAHRHRMPVVGHESRRLEPGIETVTVDLGLDSPEDFAPDIACRHGDPKLSPSRIPTFTGCGGRSRAQIGLAARLPAFRPPESTRNRPLEAHSV